MGKGGAAVVIVTINSGAGQEDVVQFLPTGLVEEVIGKESQEPFQEFTLMGLGPTQPGGGKSMAAAGLVSVLDSIKDGFELSG